MSKNLVDWASIQRRENERVGVRGSLRGRESGRERERVGEEGREWER